MTDAPPIEAERVTPSAVLAPLPDGQAALFEDPLRLLALDVGALRLLGAEVARESGSILARVRRWNGLVAWAAWYQMTELAYADWERAQAEDLQLPPTTLRRWRRDVVDAEKLPVPVMAALRSTEIKKGLAARKAAGQGQGATTERTIPAASEPVGKPETPPPGPGVAEAAVVAAGAAVVAAGARLYDPGPPPSTRAAIAHLIDHLHALDPDEAGAAMTASQLDLVLDWAEHAAKAAPRRGRAKKSEGAPRPATPVPPSGCLHPINRRIGAGCGECGLERVPK